jgi:hypothetical protein
MDQQALSPVRVVRVVVVVKPVAHRVLTVSNVKRTDRGTLRFTFVEREPDDHEDTTGADQ